MPSTYELAVSRARSNSRAFSKTSDIESSLVGNNSSSSTVAAMLSDTIKSKQGKLYEDFKYWVWVAISAIATRVAGQPYGAGKITGGKNKSVVVDSPGTQKRWIDSVPKDQQAKAIKQWVKTQTRLPTCIKEMTQGGRQVEPFYDHDILDFLAQPNSVQGKAEFLFCIIANLLITGEAYIVASDSDNEYGKEAWAFPTSWITPKHEGELFSSYVLKTTENSEPIPLPKEAVKRLYIADPNNPTKGCISPLMTQIMAVRVDESIQKSQAAMFKKIVPDLILSISETMGPNNAKVSRTLTPVQRRQVIRAVRELWRSQQANGDPAIVGDGLIDSIHKLSNQPAEMDWLNSGDQVKARIFQAFKVNPYCVGHTEGINRASALESDKAFCNQAVNPLIEQITGLLNGFVADLFDESGDTLVLWLETAEPLDVDHQRQQYQIGLSNNIIRPNQYLEYMGLPPDDDPIKERPKIVPGMVQILTAMGNSFITPESAVAALKYGCGFGEAEAEEIVGDGPPEKPEPVMVNPLLNKPSAVQPPADGQDAGKRLMAKIRMKGGFPSLSKAVVKRASAKTQTARERQTAQVLQPFFARQYRSAARKLRRLKEVTSAASIFNPRQWDKELKKTIAPQLLAAMIDGAKSEQTLKLYATLRKRMRAKAVRAEKATTASELLQELAEEYDIDLSDYPTELPQWFKEVAAQRLEETFGKDYWQAVNDTTRDQIQTIIDNGITDGLSTRDIAKDIEDISPERAGSRAMNVARTECLPADAVINGALVTGAYRRWYQGPMIEVVTHAGRKFTGTPNHPMLTQRGWVALGDLTEADDLICDNGNVKHLSLPGDVNIEQPPATIREIFDSLAAVVVIERRSGAKPDFHGDGMDAEIDVLLPDSLLRYGRFSKILQSDLHGLLAPSDNLKCFLAAECALFTKGILSQSVCLSHCAEFTATGDKSLNRGSSNAEVLGDFRTRFAGVVSQDYLVNMPICALAGGSVSSSHQQGSSVFIGPQGNASALEHIANGRRIAPEHLTDLRSAFARDIQIGDSLPLFAEPDCDGVCRRSNRDASASQGVCDAPATTAEDDGNLRGALPGRIEVDHLLLLNRIEFWEGHVFNLSTLDGYFIANGIYTGNTGNMLNAGAEMTIRQTADETGVEMTKVWMSVFGPTTRDTHAAASDQEVGIDEVFIVGGEEARWPGDENLSAGERMNCQCLPGYSTVRVIGTAVAASKMFYDGRLVKLVTRSGCRLDVTPNHPVLTTHGWIAAGELKAGMKVGRYVGRLAHENEQDKPVAIEEVFQSIRSTAASVKHARRLPFQFHGDAENGHGEIETAIADVKLPLPSSAKTFEHGQKRRFVRTASELSSAKRGGMVPALPADPLCSGFGSQNAMRFENATNRGPGAVEVIGNCDLSFAGKIGRNNRLFIKTEPLSDVRDASLSIGTISQGNSPALQSNNDCGPVATGKLSDSRREHSFIDIEPDYFFDGNSQFCPPKTNGRSVSARRDAKLSQPVDDNAGRAFGDPCNGRSGLGFIQSAKLIIGKWKNCFEHWLEFAKIRFALIANRYVVGNQDSPNSIRVCSEEFGDAGLRESLRDVEFDDLISVDVFSFRGHVYDLQTTEECYEAEGIIVHNCFLTSGIVGEELSDEDNPDPEDEDSKGQKYNPNHAPAGPGGGQFTSGDGGAGSGDSGSSGAAPAENQPAQSEQGGVHAGDLEKFQQLKSKWAQVNDELLNFVDKPNSPEAKAKSEELKAICKEMYQLHADPGGLAGIGLPGGPRDMVIIGAGPGGMASAIMGGTDGLDTLMIDGNTQIGGQAKFSSRIENYPGFPIGTTGESLAKNMFDQVERVGAETKLGVRVNSIDYDQKTGLKTLTLSNGEKIEARSVVVAGGVEFRKMDFSGSDSPSVVYADGKRMADQGRGQSVVVVGGSNGAAQAALGCAKTSAQVTVLSRGPIAKNMSDYQVQALRANPKIKIVEGDEIGKLNCDPAGRAHELVTKNGQTIPCKTLGIFVGGAPNTKWLPESVRAPDGRVTVNGDLETPMPGVFAVGDIRSGSIGRIGAAVGDGQLAARNVFGYFNRMGKIAP